MMSSVCEPAIAGDGVGIDDKLAAMLAYSLKQLPVARLGGLLRDW
jgi:hypothetical protein